ncbi:Glucoside xylosyltransferase 2 [Lamellibrachia satsuma]|nr:Glucoside xylosyltransferase 2 [Lamellibrachia satsuma]
MSRNILLFTCGIPDARFGDVCVSQSLSRLTSRKRIVVASVICGDRYEEYITFLKSAVMFTTSDIEVHAFMDDNAAHGIFNMLKLWPDIYRRKLHIVKKSVRFPPFINEQEWIFRNRLCTNLRLFLPTYLLPEVDAYIYADIDILLFRPLEALWLQFDSFNESHMISAAQRCESVRVLNEWKKKFRYDVDLPFYGKTGVNAGVMLINASRMRQLKWEEHVMRVYHKYGFRNLPLADQDIINVILATNPSEMVRPLSCEWNYKYEHCMLREASGKYVGPCAEADDRGVSLLHGSDWVFVLDTEPVFKAVSDVWREYALGKDPHEFLLQPLKRRMALVNQTNCGGKADIIIKRLEQSIIDAFGPRGTNSGGIPSRVV